MCLIVKEKDLKIADENLKCYKILDDVGTLYKTPWQRYFVSDDIVNGKETLKPESSVVEINSEIVRDGFIHSIYGYENAVMVFGIIKRMFSDIIKNPVLFECEIPAGTEYFDGVDNNSFNGFASKELRFINRIDVEQKNEEVNYERIQNE